MGNFFNRLFGQWAMTPAEQKSAHSFISMIDNQSANWSGRSYASSAQHALMRNPVAHRAISLVTQNAARVPLMVDDQGERLATHPVLDFLLRPNPDHSGPNPVNDIIVKQLVDQIREPASARYFAEFHVAKIVAGVGTSYPNNQGALSKYRVCSYNRISGCRQALSAYIRVLTGSAILSAANHSLWLNGASVSDFAELAAVDGWQHVNAIVDHEPRYASHQVTEILPLFAAIGDEVLLALPAILPDAVRVGPDDGIIPSLAVAG